MKVIFIAFSLFMICNQIDYYNIDIIDLKIEFEDTIDTSEDQLILNVFLRTNRFVFDFTLENLPFYKYIILKAHLKKKIDPPDFYFI